MDLGQLSFWISKCLAFSVFVFRAGTWATVGNKCLWEERRLKEKKKQGDKMEVREEGKIDRERVRKGRRERRKRREKSYWNEDEEEETVNRGKEKLSKRQWEWEQLCPGSSDAKGWTPLLLCSLCLPWGPDGLLPMADWLDAPTERTGWVAPSHGQLVALLHELDSRFCPVISLLSLYHLPDPSWGTVPAFMHPSVPSSICSSQRVLHWNPWSFW